MREHPHDLEGSIVHRRDCLLFQWFQCGGGHRDGKHECTCDAGRSIARRIVDVAWNAATESTAVPSTEWADNIIDSVVLSGKRTVAAHLQGDIVRAFISGSSIHRIIMTLADLHSREEVEGVIRERLRNSMRAGEIMMQAHTVHPPWREETRRNGIPGTYPNPSADCVLCWEEEGSEACIRPAHGKPK